MAKYFHEKVTEAAKAEGLEHLIIKADLQRWSDDMRKLVELDKVDKKLAGHVMNWVVTDPFWKKNILSAKKLREKFPQLAMQMKASQSPKPPQPTQQRTDTRDKDIEFQRWVGEGNDPEKFDWGK
ncbi:hypothetical protein A8F94_17345 [Bacillus sp. FJAT-27225]|nr:hypothetical protein A8F94_17345 [Bacillus sp. FJAT-27225]